MTRFSRRAGWLTHLFTPSVVPTTSFPSRVSEDVSLVQPYDGGGISVPDPSESIGEFVSPAGAQLFTGLLDTGDDQIARVYCVGATRTAGADATGVLGVQSLEKNIFCPISARFTLDGNMNGVQCLGFVVPANHRVSGHHFGGDVLTVITWQLFSALVPMGTTFRL